MLAIGVGMMGLGIALSEVPWGLLTDRWGDRRVLLTGLLATALWLVLMAAFVAPRPGHVPGNAALALGLLALGLQGGSVNGSSGRAVMAWFREGERGLAMSIRQTAVPAGGGIGALTLPMLAQAFGFAAVYGVLAALCGVTVVFAWRWMHEPPADPARAVAPASGPAGKAGPGPLGNLQVWRLVSGMGLMCVPQVAVLTFATIFLHDFSRIGIAAAGLTVAAVQVGAAAMRVWSGRWTDRHGNRRAYMRACSLLTLLVFATLAGLTWLCAAAPGRHAVLTPALMACLVLGGICTSAWHGVAFTELATIAGASRAGTALGLGNTFAFAGFFLVPMAIPVVAAGYGWPAVWLAASGSALLARPLFARQARA
ncbi:major facilitator superfamily protein [Cupriavidus basilensis OR16]|uniref:Major facilitator superfamily protein n=2 Tax=Cupriavidus basilensis TaxID=68895 RepID=H1SAP3_9BURK|nr:major facilitator superfamily protein [Cupriavidus basilensis OR16]